MTTETKTAKTIKLLARYNDLRVTPERLVELIRAGSVSVTERLARDYFDAIGDGQACVTEYNGSKRVCIVSSGISEDEFSSWKEAVLFFGT